jgi:hypothetical protein
MFRLDARAGILLATSGICRTEKFNDGSINALAGSDLEQLDVRYTAITDAGLDALKAFPKLKRLNVGGTAVTEAGVHKSGLDRTVTVFDADTR